MPTQSRNVLREFHGRLDKGDISAVLEVHADVPPPVLWQRLSSRRIPIGDGGGVGSAFVSDSARGQVTACDPFASFRLSLVYQGGRADVAFRLTSVLSDSTVLRIEARFPSIPAMRNMSVSTAVYAMVEWETLMLPIVTAEAEELSAEEDFSFAAALGSEEKVRDAVRCIESWWRATIAAGLDEGFAAVESNRVTMQLLRLRDPADPHLQGWHELQTKGAVRAHVESATAVVREERDRAVTRLLEEASEILCASGLARGEILDRGQWDVDGRLFLPFRWFDDELPVARFVGSPHEPYRVVEVVEYQLARGRFSRTRDGVAMAPWEVELPIRQVGRVVRHESESVDRIHMSWSIPRQPVEIAHVDFTAPKVDILQRASDESTKVAVTSHLGLDEALYDCLVRPDSVREYPMGPNHHRVGPA